MSDAGQPTRLKRASVGLGWLGLVVATLVAIFVLVPMGANEGLSATAPTTSPTPDGTTELTSPETWVLSSTRVTSTPAEDAPDTDSSEGDPARAPRSTPLIIQVPLDGPTTQPPTVASKASTSVAWPQYSSTTTSARASTPTTPPATDEPTCTEPTPDPGSDPDEPSDEPTPTDGESARPDDAGSSGGDDNPILDPDTCED